MEFTCTFRYDALLLQVISTVPPVGGTFSPPAPNNYQYDVNFNEPVDPASVQTSDLTVTGNSGASVTAVQRDQRKHDCAVHAAYEFRRELTASIAAGAITDQFGNPNAAFSGNYTVEGCPPQGYATATGTGTIIPGGTDIGNHCDDCNTMVNLPFPVSVYGNPISLAYAGSNGDIQFTTTPQPKVVLLARVRAGGSGSTGSVPEYLVPIL